MGISKTPAHGIAWGVLLMACLAALLSFFLYREVVSLRTVGELKTVSAPIRVLFQHRHIGTRVTLYYGVRKIKMTLYGHRGWFVYGRGLPSFETIRGSLRPRTWVTLQYGDCVDAFGLTRYCDIFGIAFADGRTLVTPDQVTAARISQSDSLAKFIVLGVFLTILLGCITAWCFRNLPRSGNHEPTDQSLN